METNKVEKPWGHYETFLKNSDKNSDEKVTVKMLFIKKGEKLSLQSHNNRDEMWIAITCGTKVQLGESFFHMNGGDRIFIPKGVKHRAWVEDESYGEDGHWILEVSFGDFDEKDIVRYDDKYGRTKTKTKSKKRSNVNRH